jgi:cell division protein FtsZ
MRGAKGLLVSITGSFNMTLYEVEEAASRIRREVDADENPEVNIIVGATFDPSLQNRVRVSVVATGIAPNEHMPLTPPAFSEREPSLADRISPVAPRRGFAPAREPASAPKPAQERRVVLEPKVRKSPENEGPGPAASSDTPQRFEPLPPSKTRPPRRPLTYQDFPELSQGGAPANAAPANRSSSKPRGFFDWMAGKDRSSKPPSTTKSVAFQSRPQGEKSLSDQENRNGSYAPQQGDSHGSDASSNRQNSEEALEIPKFFKKPVS